MAPIAYLFATRVKLGGLTPIEQINQNVAPITKTKNHTMKSKFVCKLKKEDNELGDLQKLWNYEVRTSERVNTDRKARIVMFEENPGGSITGAKNDGLPDLT